MPVPDTPSKSLAVAALLRIGDSDRPQDSPPQTKGPLPTGVSPPAKDSLPVKSAFPIKSTASRPVPSRRPARMVPTRCK